MKNIGKTFGEKITKYVMKSAKNSVREVSNRSIYQQKRPAVLDKQEKE